VREDSPGDKRLVAYCVAGGGVVLGAGVLREWCAGRLPGYMVPGVFVFVERLPLTPNGKADRRALPVPPAERPELAAEFVAPRTAAEEAIARVWAEVLGIDRVGVHDNFFELGGHSLLVVRLDSRVARLTGLTLGVREFFEAPTVASQVQHLEELIEAEERG
jgi:hypothetical protein